MPNEQRLKRLRSSCRADPCTSWSTIGGSATRAALSQRREICPARRNSVAPSALENRTQSRDSTHRHVFPTPGLDEGREKNAFTNLLGDVDRTASWPVGKPLPQSRGLAKSKLLR